MKDILIVLGVIALTGLIMVGVNKRVEECEAQGKELVRTMTNVYKCV